MRRVLLAPFALTGLCLVPGDVWTANGAKDRLPPIWTGTECMVVVDRSKDPIAHLEYGVAKDEPQADWPVGTDEPEGSRTHQFFAFGKQEFDFWGESANGSPLPIWITRDDIRETAAAEETLDPPPMELLDPEGERAEEVLTDSPIWPKGSWARITADDERVPITADQAGTGVDWDTSKVEPGAWLVAGYTYEPRENIWKVRPGLIKVTDDADDLASTGPAAFLEAREQFVDAGDTVSVLGCADAMEGSEITIELTEVRGGPTWYGVHRSVVENGPLELEFEMPACIGRPLTQQDEDAGIRNLVKLRLEIEDPQGRTYVAFSPSPISVDEPNDDKCAAEDFPELPPSVFDEADGGGCHIGSAAPLPWALWLVVAGLSRRRRRRR